MSMDIPIVAHLSREQEEIDSEAITLSPPDPHRFPVISYTPKSGNPTNIYRYSHSEVPSVYEPLFNTSRKILRKNIEKAFGTESGNISYELLMCGTFPETAKPALVVKCAMNVVEKVQKVLTQESLLKRCHLRPHGATAGFVRRIRQSMGALTDQDELTLGLEIYGCGSATRPPVRTELRGRIPDVFDTKTTGYDSRQHYSSLYGAKVNGIERNTSATLSGVIQIGTEFYGLTTSHPFRDDCFSKSRSANKHRIGNMKGWLIPVEVVLQGHEHVFQTKVWIPSIISFTSAVPNLDWALILLDKTTLRDYHLEIDTSASERSSISTHALKHPGWEPEILTLCFGEEPKRGALLQGTVYYTNCLSAEVAVWTVALEEDCPVEKGDSGSLVIEADIGVAYGYVVARDTFGRAEIIPLHSALNQISSLTGIDHVEFMDRASLACRQTPVHNLVKALEEPQLIPPTLSRSASIIVEEDEFRETNREHTADINRNTQANATEGLVTEPTKTSPDAYVKYHSRDDFEVAIICAPDTDTIAARTLLDEEYRFEQNNDQNHYTLGRIGNHNVVVAHLPSVVCLDALATTSIEIRRVFPSMQWGIVVDTVLIGFDVYLRTVNVNRRLLLGDYAVIAYDMERQLLLKSGFPDHLYGGTFETLIGYLASAQRQACEDDQLRPNYSIPCRIDAPSIDLATRDWLNPCSDGPEYRYPLHTCAEVARSHSLSRHRFETPALKGFRDADSLLARHDIYDYADNHKNNQRHNRRAPPMEIYIPYSGRSQKSATQRDMPAARRRRRESIISNPIETLKHNYDVVVIGSGYGGIVASTRMARGREPPSLLELGRERWPCEALSSLPSWRDVRVGTSSLEPSNSPDSCWFLAAISSLQATPSSGRSTLGFYLPGSSVNKGELWHRCESDDQLESESSSLTSFGRWPRLQIQASSLINHDWQWHIPTRDERSIRNECEEVLHSISHFWSQFLHSLNSFGRKQRLKELQLSAMGWVMEGMIRKWPISFGSHKGEWILIQANTDELHEQDVPRTDSERHRRRTDVKRRCIHSSGVYQELKAIVTLSGGIPMLLLGGQRVQPNLCLQIWLSEQYPYVCGHKLSRISECKYPICLSGLVFTLIL